MNNAIMNKVVAINNQCIEDLNDGNIANAFSELFMAMNLIKQFVDPIRLDSHIAELQQNPPSNSPRPTSPMIVSTYQNLPSHYHHQQESSSTIVTVQVKFHITSATSLLSSRLSPTPIVRCQHPLILVANYTIDEQLSIVNHVGNENGVESTEHVQVVCATLLYNLAFLCHKYAYIGNHRNHPDPANIIRASKIYELLIQFCNQCSMVVTMHHHHFSNLKMILMIAYNNYAEICYTSDNFVKYVHCMHTLQSQLLLSSLHSSSTGSNDNTNIPNDARDVIYNELLLNAFVARLLSMPTLASAA